jgi:hypothetical protein
MNAASLGLECREAQRAVKIDSIAPEAKEAAREAGLDDSQSALIKVAAAPPGRQVDVVRDLAAVRTAPPALAECAWKAPECAWSALQKHQAHSVKY